MPVQELGLRIAAIVAVAIVAAGCQTTPNEALSKPPSAIFQSTQAAHSIADCIKTRWEESGIVTVHRMVDEKHRVMGYFGANDLGHLAEVRVREAGAVADYYEIVPALVTNQWRDAVRLCVAPN